MGLRVASRGLAEVIFALFWSAGSNDYAASSAGVGACWGKSVGLANTDLQAVTMYAVLTGGADHLRANARPNARPSSPGNGGGSH